MKTYITLLFLVALLYIPIHLLLILQLPDSMHGSDSVGEVLPEYRGKFGVNLFGWFTGTFLSIFLWY